MIPEKILQTDLLDILFENKNKSYGAYLLRRHYAVHLTKALFITAVASISFFLFLQLKPVKQSVSSLFIIPPDGLKITQVEVENDLPRSKQVKPPVTMPKANTVDYQQVVIVPDDAVPQNMVDVNTLNDANISNANITGDADVPADIVEPITGGGSGNIEPVVKSVEPTEPAVLNFAEIMPAYPGGVQALKRFMERNLVKPDNLEPGESVVIRAKFIVGVTGAIEQVELLNDGPAELKKTVLQTIAKMPSWSPGMQNGHPVAVYFVLPITFMASDD